MIDPELHEEGQSITGRTLRQFGFLWLVIFGGLACWEWFNRDQTTGGLAWALVALLVGLPGLLWPMSIRWLFAALLAVTWPIGWVVSKVLLAILFFCVFTPVALFFRLIGRDVLARRRRPELQTFWQPWTAPRDVRGYFRQS
jgi:hypothetical protein